MGGIMTRRISAEQKYQIEPATGTVDDLKKLYKKNKNSQIRTRLQIIHLRYKGLSLQDISDFAICSVQHVKNTITTFKYQGIKATLTLKYTGDPGNLTKEEKKELDQYVANNRPDTAKQIVKWIKINFFKEFTTSGVTKLLKRLSFSWKKPKLIPGTENQRRYQCTHTLLDYLVYVLEFDPKICEELQKSLPEKPCSEKKFDKTLEELCGKTLEELFKKKDQKKYRDLIRSKACISDSSPVGQRRFIKEYNEVRKFCGRGVSVLFCDAMHLVHNTVNSYCWLRKGKTTYMPSTSGRHRLNIVGAFNIEDFNLYFKADESNCDHKTILSFFKKLEREMADEIHSIIVILDNAAYHRHPEIMEFLKTSTIILWFLPPYCPNLNLIERFWKFAKKHLVVNTFEEKYKTFRSNVFRLLGNLDPYMGELKSLITENFEIIGVDV